MMQISSTQCASRYRTSTHETILDAYLGYFGIGIDLYKSPSFINEIYFTSRALVLRG